jgi:hypothetical protein
VKALFASLLCLVLTATQTFAIKGGPPYPAGTNLVGTFAGVMQGAFDPTNPNSSNTIGVYSLGIPKAGNATGPFVMFARGRVFSGTVQGTADPTKATIKCVMNASFNYNLLVPVTETTTNSNGTTSTKTTFQTLAISATANGPLTSTVSSIKSKNLVTSSTIMQGTATLNVSQGAINSSTGAPIITDIISLTVSGYKQSDAEPTSAGG